MQLSPEQRMYACVAFIVPILLVLMVVAGWEGLTAGGPAQPAAGCATCADADCLKALRCAR